MQTHTSSLTVESGEVPLVSGWLDKVEGLGQALRVYIHHESLLDHHPTYPRRFLPIKQEREMKRRRRLRRAAMSFSGTSVLLRHMHHQQYPRKREHEVYVHRVGAYIATPPHCPFCVLLSDLRFLCFACSFSLLSVLSGESHPSPAFLFRSFLILSSATHANSILTAKDYSSPESQIVSLPAAYGNSIDAAVDPFGDFSNKQTSSIMAKCMAEKTEPRKKAWIIIHYAMIQTWVVLDRLVECTTNSQKADAPKSPDEKLGLFMARQVLLDHTHAQRFFQFFQTVEQFNPFAEKLGFFKNKAEATKAGQCALPGVAGAEFPGPGSQIVTSRKIAQRRKEEESADSQETEDCLFLAEAGNRRGDRLRGKTTRESERERNSEG